MSSESTSLNETLPVDGSRVDTNTLQLREAYIAKLRLFNLKYNITSNVSKRVEQFELGQVSTEVLPDYSVLREFEAYLARIEFLQSEAVEEGIIWNEVSEHDFWRFVGLSPEFRKGNLVLKNNGNLRAKWRDIHRNQIGLQFLGEGLFQYVLLRRHAVSLDVSSEAGRGSFREFLQSIESLELRALLYRCGAQNSPQMTT